MSAELPTLNPDCPSCQCGGQLCSEHGLGFDPRIRTPDIIKEGTKT